MSMKTDFASTFDEPSSMKQVGFDMTQAAAGDALGQARLSPQQVDVVELHDCFSANELITYEGLGLCPEGGAAAFIDRAADKNSLVNSASAWAALGWPGHSSTNLGRS